MTEKKERLIGRKRKLSKSDIFNLRVQDQLSFEGIAERLGISVVSVINTCRNEARRRIQAETSGLAKLELTRRANQMINFKKKERMFGRTQKMSAEEIFLMRARDKKDFEIIAKQLGIAVETVRSICIEQARNFFKNAVLPQMPEEEITRQINEILGISRVRKSGIENSITLPADELKTLLIQFQKKSPEEIATLLHQIGQPPDQPLSPEAVISLYQHFGIQNKLD